MLETPFNQIKQSLSGEIPLESMKYLPDKWEKIGDVLTIKLDRNLEKYQEKVGQTYAEILQCKTVLKDVGGISGIFREPKVEIIYGSTNTETLHIENSIKFKLDPQKIMFSSGNMDERLRMAKISNKNETVVDLFAGVGYFTLPMAVFSRSKRIFACEVNPVAYNYLCKNIVLNHVPSIVQPLFGDNRTTAPKNVADRVITGYIGDTHRFLPVAIECLKDFIGTIHYHDVFQNKTIPNKPMKDAQKIIDGYDRKAKLLTYRCIKSYAPSLTHAVLDIRLDAK
jgi:tRNA wybutosine-synthesizing protein 2